MLKEQAVLRCWFDFFLENAVAELEIFHPPQIHQQLDLKARSSAMKVENGRGHAFLWDLKSQQLCLTD